MTETSEFKPCPTPAMIAAAWAVVKNNKNGIGKLGPGLGVVELWQEMEAARTHPPEYARLIEAAEAVRQAHYSMRGSESEAQTKLFAALAAIKETRP